MFEDVKAVMKRDPAATNFLEVFFLYPGVKAIRMYRRANWFWRHNMKFIARYISQTAAHKTGIEIHPAATIAPGVFIDHGEGVVIGETAVVETGVVIYQGVTLGGTGKDKGKKRHPTIKKGCMISAGAKVLGGITVGEYCKIGASSVVLQDVPPYSTVVGIPGKVIKQNGQKLPDLEQDKRDPVLDEINALKKRIEELEMKVK